jgi:uncharacterized protein involved in response to NO
MLALVAVDLFAPSHASAPILAALVAVLALARSLTWGTRLTRRHPLLWILHAAHAWIVLGLALRAVIAVAPFLQPAAWLHALTLGGLGCATLGMMARVSLGHTGRPLAVRWPMTLAFATLVLATTIRVFGPMVPGGYRVAIDGAGALWTLAFAVFVACYARVLVSPRADGKPG